MTWNIKTVRIFAGLVIVKSIMGIVLALVGATTLPSSILGGLSLIWLLGALLLLWLLRSAEKQSARYSLTVFRFKKRKAAGKKRTELGQPIGRQQAQGSGN